MHFMKINIFIIFMAAFGLLFGSCVKNQPAKMSREDFSKLYAYLAVLSETVPASSDSLVRIRQQKRDSLFVAWGRSEKDFRDMVKLYHQTPGEWPEILRLVGQEIDSLRAIQK